MIATTQANASSCPKQLLKLSEASSLIGIDSQRLRRMADRGAIRTVRLSSGHRLFPLSSITHLLQGRRDETSETNATDVPVILCARVSSDGQAKKRGSSDASDLERQINRLEEYIGERWGESARVTKNVRVASGCNFQSKELHELLKLIWSGKFKGGYLVATYFDRVLRIGWELIELACREFGVEVVYISEQADEDADENSQMISELLAIMTLYTSRASAKKTIQTQRRVLNEEQLRRAWTDFCGGHSYETIAKNFKARGEMTPNGPVTRKVIENQIKLNRKLLTKLYPPESIESNFTVWAKATLVPTDANDTSSFIYRGDIVKRYLEHCKRHELQPISVLNVMAGQLKRLGYTVRRIGHSGKTGVNARFVA